MPKIQLDLSDDLIVELDTHAKKLLSNNRAPSMFTWMTQTREGKLYWAQQRQKTHLTEEQMTAEVKAEWRRVTGGAQIGRPRMMDARLTVLKEALLLYSEQARKTTESKVLPYPVKR